MSERRLEEIPIHMIDPFPDHPFKVQDDEDMDDLIESIRSKGVLMPCIVRPKKDGRYELIAGHRRKYACEQLGIENLWCEVMELTRPQATILMVESNFQRDRILPSEKAFAYKMRLEAMKKHISRLVQNQKGGFTFAGGSVEEELEEARRHLAASYGISQAKVDRIGTPEGRLRKEPVEPQGTPVGYPNKTIGKLAAISEDSREQIRRYIRLTELVPEILDLVDEGKIAMRPAVEISYLKEDQQRDLYDCILKEQCTPSFSQAVRMRKMLKDRNLTKEAIMTIMMEEKPNQKERISLDSERVNKYFPKRLPAHRRVEYIEKALEFYGRYLERKERDHER